MADQYTQPGAPAGNTAAPDPNDPFRAIGGGVKLANGSWVPKDHPLAKQAQYQAPAAPAAAPEAPAGPSFADQVRNNIIGQMSQNPTQASITDPDIAPVAEANRNALERARRGSQDALAERFAAEGMPVNSGAFDTAVQRGFQEAGQAQGAFEANLVNQKLQERRANIMQALQLGAGLLSDDQRNALQLQLAQLDAAVQREGLSTQRDLASMDDATKRMLGIGGLNLGFIEAMLNQRNADNRLGFDIGNAEALYNQNALDRIFR